MRRIATIAYAAGVLFAGSPTFAQSRFVDPGTNDPQTRLFFAPTARALQRGEGYVGTYNFLLPFGQVGLTDRISIGGGFLPIPLEGAPPFWITPKVQIVNADRVKVAAGVLEGVLGGHVSEPFGIAYAVTTIGGRNLSLTANVGLAYAHYDNTVDTSVVGMVGFEHRVAPSVTLMSENHILPRTVLSFTGLSLRKAGTSWNFGLEIALDTKVGEPVPMAPIAIPVWRWMPR